MRPAAEVLQPLEGERDTELLGAGGEGVEDVEGAVEEAPSEGEDVEALVAGGVATACSPESVGTARSRATLGLSVTLDLRAGHPPACIHPEARPRREVRLKEAPVM